MVDFCVFNELSLPLDKHKAKNNFGLFFGLLKELKEKNLTQIRMSDDFKNCNILEEVTFEKFLGQQTDKAFQTRLKSFINNGITLIDSPIIKDTDKKQMDIKNKTDYFFNEAPTDGGLACCDIWDTIAISFKTSEEWDTSGIAIHKNMLDDNGAIVDKKVVIKHASSNSHLDNHSIFFDTLENEVKLDIAKVDFWEKRTSNFPNKIRFCKEVEGTIRNLNDTVFQKSMSLLRDIETERKKISDFPYSGESSTVKNNSKLSEIRKFTVESEKIFFENHFKIGDGRIYFLERNAQIYIGYIGKHLPTSRYS